MFCCFCNCEEEDDWDYQIFYEDEYDHINNNSKPKPWKPLDYPTFDEPLLKDILKQLQRLLKDIFNIYDRDHNGYIKEVDFIYVNRILAKTWKTPNAEAQIYAKFLHLDKTENKQLTFEEFIYPKVLFICNAYQRDVKRSQLGMDHERDKWEESIFIMNSLITSSTLCLKTLKQIFDTTEQQQQQQYYDHSQNQNLLEIDNVSMTRTISPTLSINDASLQQTN